MIDRLTWRVGFIASAILAALLFVGFATQTIRIEGFNVWPIKHEGFKAANERMRHDLDEIEKSTKEADRKAREAKAAAEAEYKRKAELTDAKHQSELAEARRRASAYADRNRVPAPPSGRPSSGASPSADCNGAPCPDRSGADSGVVVTRADFDVMVDNTLRLKAAREWACSLDGAKCD